MQDFGALGLGATLAARNQCEKNDSDQENPVAAEYHGPDREIQIEEQHIGIKIQILNH
jgi:hypothetical protein